MDTTESPDSPAFLVGGGEMGQRMRTFDWSTTPIGPVESWPQSLRTSVSICLKSLFPILVWWGPEFIMIYNDAYRPMLGQTKHPKALGQPGRECWPEIWDVIGPMLEGVLATGEATWSDDQLLSLDRNGYLEECYFTFSYSPIADDTGKVGGVFCAVTENTGRVLGERRTRTLRSLAAHAVESRTELGAIQAMVEVLAEDPHDLPFALLYLLEPEGRRARLSGEVGLSRGLPASPEAVEIESGERRGIAGAIARVALTRRAESVAGLASLYGHLPGGPWPDSPDCALVLPIDQPGQAALAGVLVAGISPRKALDDDYRGFLELVAGQIATAIADARAYEAERQRAEALAALDRAKTAFFSNVSHEFRTPLTLLLGPLREALADPEARNRHDLEIAHRNALRLQKLVNSLLDFARIEAGRVEAVYEPTDLAAVTADLASVFRSAVERAGLRLVVDCPELPEPVYVDREMWEKIVLNLLSNALKFTFEGEIAVRLRQVGGQAVLTVSDTGVGIPQSELPRLFERFHRVQSPRARTHEGTGIGLALVQELVRLHGGSVEVSSAQGDAADGAGHGTTLTVRVPIGTDHLPVGRIGVSRSLASTGIGAVPFVEEALRWLPDGSPAGDLFPTTDPGPRSAFIETGAARVLVVDDNADMRDYLEHLLARHWTVEAVGDGLSALAAARRSPPDLVLTDVMLPGLDGFGLVHELRADPALGRVPIVLLSARAGEESRVEGMAAGADDYLVKPFSARELTTRVGAHLALARQRREAEEALESQNEELRQKSALLEAINEATPTLIYVKDLQGRMVMANPAALALLGKSASEVIGHTDWDYLPAEIAESNYAHDRKVMDEGVTESFEEVTETPMGRRVWLSVKSPYRDRTGRIVGLVGVSTDITAQNVAAEERERLLAQVREVNGQLATATLEAHERAAEADRRAAELDATIGSMADGVILYAPDGSLAFANNGARQILGYSSDLWELPLADRARVVQFETTDGQRLSPEQVPVARALRGETVHNVAIVVKRTDGSRVWISVSAAPIASPSGQLLGAVASFADVTALRELEEQREDFIRAITHDLRNPLTAVLGVAQMIGRLADRPEMVRKGADQIAANARRMNSMLVDLVDSARLAAGQLQLARQPVDLASAAYALKDRLLTAGDGQGERVRIAIDEVLPPVSANPEALDRILANLVSNALKYSPPDAEVTLGIARQGHEAVVSVRDQGIGIAQDDLSRLFERYYRAKGTRERNDSLGLGLYITKGLVEAQHGRIWAESQVGQGSTFCFTLKLE